MKIPNTCSPATTLCVAGALLFSLALPRPAAASSMIGYWEDWNSITLGNVSSNYDVIDVAFGLPGGANGSTISFSQTVESQSQLVTDIKSQQGKGKKVLLSIGGASAANCSLQNSTDADTFVSSVEGIISTYGFNGIDLDLENGALNLNGGDTNFESPTTPSSVYLISALTTLYNHYGSGFMITFAPQTEDVDAYGSYGGGWGDYLPVIYGTRNFLSFVAIQCYDSGSMYARNGQAIGEGTADFPVAMADLLLAGYKAANGQSFPALSASQVAMGVPATSAAAGSGYIAPSIALQGLKYVKNGISYGGGYTLSNSGGYSTLGGVMTWDIDYDQNNGLALSGALDSTLHAGGSGGGGGLTAGNHGLAPECATSSRMDDSNNGTNNGNPVILWPSNGGSNQNWNFASVSGGWNAATLGPYCLDDDGGGNKQVVVWSCNGGSNQLWKSTTNSDGSVTLTNGTTGECLDDFNSGTGAGNVIGTWGCGGGTNQKWIVH